MKQNRMKKGYIVTVALLGALGAASVMPASAQAASELQALKRAVAEQNRKMAEQSRQLAEQRALIDKLLSAQTSQKAAIEKIETGKAPAPALVQASAQAPAQAAPQTAAQAVNGLLPRGMSITGAVDVNVMAMDAGYGRKFSVGSGGMTASNLAFKLDREIEPGWRAVANLDMGIDFSTGIAGNGSSQNNDPFAYGNQNTSFSTNGFSGQGVQLFSREIYGGLQSDALGRLTFGRQYTGSFIMDFMESNPFTVGMFGTTAALFPTVSGLPTRVNNSIIYKASISDGALKGFAVIASYFAGQENNIDTPVAAAALGGYVTDSSGEGYDLALFYRGVKNLSVALSGWATKATVFVPTYETSPDNRRGLQATVNYDFGYVKLYGTYVKSWWANLANNSRAYAYTDSYSIGGKVPFGRHAFLAAFSQVFDNSRYRNAAGQHDLNVSLIGLGYTYKLFAGTDSTVLYVNWGKQFNGKAATQPLKNGADMVGVFSTKPGTDPDGIEVGINYKF